MEITYIIVVGIVAYIFGAINKLFVDEVPNKFIPIQNVGIGIVAGIICYFTKIEPDLLQSVFLCLIATMSAGGIADLTKIFKKEGN